MVVNAVSLRFMCVIIVTITTILASINVDRVANDDDDDRDRDHDMRLRTLCAFLSSLLLSQEVVDFQSAQSVNCTLYTDL